MKSEEQILAEWATNEITLDAANERYVLDQDQFRKMAEGMRAGRYEGLSRNEMYDRVGRARRKFFSGATRHFTDETANAWLDRFFDYRNIMRFESVTDICKYLTDMGKMLEDTRPPKNQTERRKRSRRRIDIPIRPGQISKTELSIFQ